MALITCPECTGNVSDKAYTCPHCGYPMKGELSKPKAKRIGKRRANGAGSVVYLKAKKKNPYQVRVNTCIDKRGYPKFDSLGYFPTKEEAEIALADFNKDPFNPDNRKRTFSEVFEAWYKYKFSESPFSKKKKTNTQHCHMAAYKKCETLYNKVMQDIQVDQLQAILSDASLSHSTLEHVKNLFNQMYTFALQRDIVTKNIAKYATIKVKDTISTKHFPYTEQELELLWKNKDKPFVDTILIYCYSGFRISELAEMPLEKIDLENRTFTGGKKNKYSRNRTVPIHSKIYDLVKARYNTDFESLIYHDGTCAISATLYRKYYKQALEQCGINTLHTPHDSRHTFNCLMITNNIDKVVRCKLMGQSGRDINENVYSKLSVDQLRTELEKI